MRFAVPPHWRVRTRRCAWACTRASASCATGGSTGPALEIAAGVARAAAPGEILATSTVADLVAGSGIEFSERGAVELPLAGASREWRLFSVER